MTDKHFVASLEVPTEDLHNPKFKREFKLMLLKQLIQVLAFAIFREVEPEEYEVNEQTTLLKYKFKISKV